MRFSVLIPSRNRFSLARMAIETVLRQGIADIEIIVSDNASDDDYAAMIGAFKDERIKLFREPERISVTANWNRALARASGDYVVMLGDDDGLAPGHLERMSALIDEFGHPDQIFCKAYHYAYPDALPGKPHGYFATVGNSSLFKGHAKPYLLDSNVARQLGKSVLLFRHYISFNSQHYIWKRTFIESLSYLGPFFQSTYPDFYAAALSFLKAKRTVVDPQPFVIIGISTRSFGHFFARSREEEGAEAFLHTERDRRVGDTRKAEILSALSLSGSLHYRNWLLAAARVADNLNREGTLGIDFRRYRKLQIFSCAHRYAFLRTIDRKRLTQFATLLDDRERRVLARFIYLFSVVSRLKVVDHSTLSYDLNQLLGVHTAPEIEFHQIGPHDTILDAFLWLEMRNREKSAFASLKQTGPVGLFGRIRRRRALRRQAKLIQRSGLFDREWYMAQYPDARQKGVGPVMHYLEFGAAQGYDPSPLFDTKWYVTRYSDVQGAGVNPVLHFLQHGVGEGCNPNPLFDSGWYLERYPDVQMARANPLVHYVRYGSAEGRDPGPRFDTKWYLASYPDVRRAGMNPLAHYLRIGLAEGRFGRPRPVQSRAPE
ncbi:MAG TPA: glycosyltransferase family 2 protein [Vineibacter sp.]|nr:glycosyltransferase family 2 protein [Vineibacter sp.]